MRPLPVKHQPLPREDVTSPPRSAGNTVAHVPGLTHAQLATDTRARVWSKTHSSCRTMSQSGLLKAAAPGLAAPSCEYPQSSGGPTYRTKSDFSVRGQM